jgi:hypothetical protein
VTAPHGLVLGLFLLAGCQPWSVREQPKEPPGEPDKGRLQLKAVRDSSGRSAGEVLWSVWTPDGLVVFRQGEPAPTALQEATPGPYRVILTEKRGYVHQTDVDVRPGRETVLQFNRSAARSAENAEEFALVTGKTLMYIGVGVFYVFYAWCSACADSPVDLFDDDDDEEDSGSSTSTKKDKAKAGEPKPKVGDILKPEKKP